MTREEAELAAATFEFPPFRARAMRWDGFIYGDTGEYWILEVTSPSGLTWPITSTEEWLGIYDGYCAVRRRVAASERSASDGATRDVPADTGA